VESSHASSSRRIVVGEGMVSGVWVYERLVVKWVRRVEISCAVKPEDRRRSKPWGAGVVDVVGAAEELVRLLVGSSLDVVVSLVLWAELVA